MTNPTRNKLPFCMRNFQRSAIKKNFAVNCQIDITFCQFVVVAQLNIQQIIILVNCDFQVTHPSSNKIPLKRFKLIVLIFSF